MLGIMAAIPFFMAKASAETELLAKAERDLKESKRIAAVKTEVENVVSDVMPKVVQRIDFPDRFYSIVTQMVNKSPYIVGAGIAFLPDYYANLDKEKLFAPYAYDEQPSVRVKKQKTEEPMIRTRLLDFDYTTREWFRTPVEKEKNLWTQPYVDQGGTKIIMCTFVEPIRDRTGHVVGVLFADVPMEDVSILSMDMDGLIERGGRISVMVMLVFLGLFCVILWLSIRASQRYRKDTYDSEIQKLKSEIEHLKTINRKLMQRNLDLSKKESASHFLG